MDDDTTVGPSTPADEPKPADEAKPKGKRVGTKKAQDPNVMGLSAYCKINGLNDGVKARMESRLRRRDDEVKSDDLKPESFWTEVYKSAMS